VVRFAEVKTMKDSEERAILSKSDWKRILAMFRVEPGRKVRLKDYDTGWMGTKELTALGKEEVKARARAFLDRKLAELSEAQALLYANGTYSVLVVLQAMDAAGKDGIIKHVMSGMNPQGCQVYSFKAPSAEELDHTWLWRYMKAVPQRGRICIFNRSHYEDVLVVKVHQEFLAKQKLPQEYLEAKHFWEDRYEDINAFERHLARNGTIIVKLFLHLSEEEQKRRFLERLDTPEKNWKFSASDIAERTHWDRYQKAFEEALNATSTDWAPWYVIPADKKWVSRALVAEILASAIRDLDLSYPRVPPEKRKELAKAREQLEAE
jgi:PPK2 family polyphosphate:nucleotide phosphotransferase